MLEKITYKEKMLQKSRDAIAELQDAQETLKEQLKEERRQQTGLQVMFDEDA